jgi:signal peptidase II
MSNPIEPPAEASEHAPDAPTPAVHGDGPAHETKPSANARLVVLLGALALLVAVVDQVTKAWAQDALSDGHVVDVLGDWLTLQIVYNPGAALSIATGMTWLLTIVVIVVIVMIVRATRRLRSKAWAVALGLLLGGAIGNLVDRLLRQPSFGRGRVVDFIGYGDWFVGNVADIAIVGAAVMIAVLAVLGIGMDGKRTPAEPRHEAQ